MVAQMVQNSVSFTARPCLIVGERGREDQVANFGKNPLKFTQFL